MVPPSPVWRAGLTASSGVGVGDGGLCAPGLRLSPGPCSPPPKRLNICSITWRKHRTPSDSVDTVIRMETSPKVPSPPTAGPHCFGGLTELAEGSAPPGEVLPPGRQAPPTPSCLHPTPGTSQTVPQTHSSSLKVALGLPGALEPPTGREAPGRMESHLWIQPSLARPLSPTCEVEPTPPPPTCCSGVH